MWAVVQKRGHSQILWTVDCWQALHTDSSVNRWRMTGTRLGSCGSREPQQVPEGMHDRMKAVLKKHHCLRMDMQFILPLSCSKTLAARRQTTFWALSSLLLNSRFCYSCAAFGQCYLISNPYSKGNGAGNPKPQLEIPPWDWDPGCGTSGKLLYLSELSFLTCKWWFKYPLNKYLLSICYMPSTVIEMGSVVTK